MVIENVRVFDGDSLRPPSTLVIDGAVIGRDPTDAAEVVDAKGGTLLPGLIESHAHPEDMTDIQSLTKYGVTTAFVLASYAPRQNMSLHGHAGLVDVHYASAPAVAPGSLHGRLVGRYNSDPQLLVKSPEDAYRWVEEQLTWDPEFFKVVAQSPGLAQETLNVLVEEGHRHGKKVVCHAADLISHRQAMNAGVDQIHHSPADVVADEELARQIRLRGQISVPTLIMMKVLAEGAGPGPARDYAASRETVRRYHEAQIPILAGTDANKVVASVPFGKTLHQELELLVEAGLSPVQALRSATSLPALHWGLADRGVIAPGYRADLVLIDGDPTADIKATQNLRRMWIAGKEYTQPLGNFNN